MDEQRRGRIRDDLKGFFRGDLFFDDLTRSLYSTDASIFQVQPAGVVMPRDEEDLQNLVRFAYQEKIPLVPRGGGTGLAGESLGKGLIVDLSKHFRAMSEPTSDAVRVQPGVVLDRLQERLRKEGRHFAPQPASGWACTLGGMVANNASGGDALLHGYTRDHLHDLRLVLDNGEAVTVGRVPLPLPFPSGSSRLNDILEGLLPLLEGNQELIQTCQPRTLFHRCGYLLANVYSSTHLDLCRLLAGSEGTLGFFTEITLRTIPLAGGKATAVLCFDGLEQALRAALEIAPLRPAVCDLMGRRLFTLVRGKEGMAGQIPPFTEAILLVEFEGPRQEEADSALASCLGGLQSAGLVPLARFTALEGKEQLEVNQLREAAFSSLYAVKGAAQPVPFVEDVAVPLEHLSECVMRIQGILKEHQTTATFLIHAASGQIHTRPFLDLTHPEQISLLSAISDRVHALVLSLGGSISCQHGTGLARTSWVARQYGPLYPVLRQIKALFDPRNIFNPGKIVDPDPELGSWPLRRFAPVTDEPSWNLTWRKGEVATEANHCNGCGQCRTEDPRLRMCPVFRAERIEAASPRGKANLVRHLLAEGQPGPLSTNAVREVADLCIHCKMCMVECPARINIHKLMLEAKAANVAQQGLARRDWFLARLEGFLHWGSMLPFLGNFVLRSGTVRWVLEKVFGLSARRRLPRLARRSFWSIARRRGWTERSPARRPTVVYFPDLYTTYVDPDLGEATGLVLEHNGFDVFVPRGLRSSGIEALVVGDVDSVREKALVNLRLLAEPAREGLPIICSEPSAAVMLRQEYPDLIDDLDARLVSERAVEAMAFLADLARQGKLQKDFRPQDWHLGHHVPCHVKALAAGIPGPDLLRLIPGVRVETLDISCSGMAGTFGLKAENLRTSLAAGRPMLEALEKGPMRTGSSECSSCRLQMENAAGKRTLHPIQYLALAYGLMPHLAERLNQPVKDKLTP